MENNFRDTYQALPTMKLIAIANSSDDEYKTEAIQAAREELDSRGENWQDADLVIEAKTSEAAIYDTMLIQINGSECTLASLGSRLACQISDGLAGFGIGLVTFLVLNFLKIGEEVSIIVFAVIIYAYLLFSDGFKGGQSLGKRVLKIAVIDAKTGTPCSYWKSFVRNFIQILGIFDWIFIFGDKRQRLGDKVAGTVVIRSENSI